MENVKDKNFAKLDYPNNIIVTDLRRCLDRMSKHGKRYVVRKSLIGSNQTEFCFYKKTFFTTSPDNTSHLFDINFESQIAVNPAGAYMAGGCADFKDVKKVRIYIFGKNFGLDISNENYYNMLFDFCKIIYSNQEERAVKKICKYLKSV